MAWLKIFVVSSLVAIVSVLFYNQPDLFSSFFDKTSTSDNRNDNGEVLLTQEQLARYNGEDGSPGIYLAILGNVFDVTKGEKHYGKDGHYHFFTGKDASKAFVSGDFTDQGLIDDLSTLKPEEWVGLEEWIGFYKKSYTYVGKLIGRFYDEKGTPTPYMLEAEEKIREGYRVKEQSKKKLEEFPPCNSEWHADKGGRVYCSELSGGIERDWIGYPRKLYQPGSSNHRCACVNEKDLNNPQLKPYNGCPDRSYSCVTD